MKNLKVALLAFAMLLGIGGAFAYQSLIPCPEGSLFVLDPAQSLPADVWNGNGAPAADQALSHYIPAPPATEYDCITANVVCTFVIDESAPVGQKVKECIQGSLQ